MKKRQLRFVCFLGIFARGLWLHGRYRQNNGTTDAGLTSPPAIAQTPSDSLFRYAGYRGNNISPSMPLVPTDSPDASASPGTSAAASPSPYGRVFASGGVNFGIVNECGAESLRGFALVFPPALALHFWKL